eukprot:GHVU01080992.1.p2 GENE.GHVU01080992.1~~GHVU01080992.1.p2  ORF type:complete len:129 (-),score=10.06 GHVU01080992.1:27-413(-)
METKLECRLCRVDKPETTRAATDSDGNVRVITNPKLPRLPKFYKKARLRAFRRHCLLYHQAALPVFRDRVATGGDLTAYDRVNAASVLDLGSDLTSTPTAKLTHMQAQPIARRIVSIEMYTRVASVSR